jgi:hypothetical protein
MDYRHEKTYITIRDENSEIYYKNLKTGKETRVTKNSNPDYSPEIFENKIIWKRRSGEKEELLLYIIPE